MDLPAPLPWYRHFWPWFLVGIVGSAVIASVVSAVIAFENGDSLVREDWYQDGTAINRRLERDRAARNLAVVATLRTQAGSGELRVELEGRTTDSVRALQLEFSHPTLAERDRAVTALRTPSGDFRASIGEPLVGRWYLSIAPAAGATGAVSEGPWRLSSSITLPSSRALRIEAGP